MRSLVTACRRRVEPRMMRFPRVTQGRAPVTTANGAGRAGPGTSARRQGQAGALARPRTQVTIISPGRLSTRLTNVGLATIIIQNLEG